jgi:hypothetical protein
MKIKKNINVKFNQQNEKKNINVKLINKTGNK